MVITKTPYRVSFFGGGTDYPKWYLKEEGAVLSSTIDKYCYISCRIFPAYFNVKYRVIWSHIENVCSVSEILHPAVREGIRFLGLGETNGHCLEIHYQGDLPARSGMGSSSTFAVGLIKALKAIRGEMIGKHELALKAIELEQNILKEHVGSQDQVAAAFGGLNILRFLSNNQIKVEPIVLSTSRISELESRLMLFYTGTSRLASEIAGEVIASLDKKQEVLRKMHSFVGVACSILADGTLDDFGRILHENWLLKRSISDVVSNPTIDMIYDKAMANGALGGKLLGAGSTGFMLFYVPIERQAQVKDALYGLIHVPFKFEGEGSSVIYYTERY
jgi:D-glycero-alpha-D-manno-heptose-7-phosphate kinase